MFLQGKGFLLACLATNVGSLQKACTQLSLSFTALQRCIQEKTFAFQAALSAEYYNTHDEPQLPYGEEACKGANQSLFPIGAIVVKFIQNSPRIHFKLLNVLSGFSFSFSLLLATCNRILISVVESYQSAPWE